MSGRIFASLLACFAASVTLTANQEEQPGVLYSTPSGTWRIERNGEKAWVISNKDPAQRAELPPLEGISPFDDEFHASPNDEWLFGVRKMAHGFSSRTKGFEMTDYLRKLNKTKSEALACAEPIDPLPSEAELKTRFDKLDQQLNKTYGEVIAKRRRTALLWCAKLNAHGLSIAMRVQNSMFHCSRKANVNTAVSSFWGT